MLFEIKAFCHRFINSLEYSKSVRVEREHEFVLGDSITRIEKWDLVKLLRENGVTPARPLGIAKPKLAKVSPCGILSNSPLVPDA